MSTLEVMCYKFSLRQWDPSPAWVSFSVSGGDANEDYRFTGQEFLTFVAWLSAEAKKIKTDEEIEKEMREKYR